jgi:hypothetical protein
VQKPLLTAQFTSFSRVAGAIICGTAFANANKRKAIDF